MYSPYVFLLYAKRGERDWGITVWDVVGPYSTRSSHKFRAAQRGRRIGGCRDRVRKSVRRNEVLRPKSVERRRAIIACDRHFLELVATKEFADNFGLSRPRATKVRIRMSGEFIGKTAAAPNPIRRHLFSSSSFNGDLTP